MQIKCFSLNSLQYAVRYPSNYEPGKQYPVLFLFHGAGGRGTDINVLLDNPFFRITNKYEDFPFLTIAPLCSANTWFDLFGDVKRLVAEILSQPSADPQRVYAIGASMGGYMTWQLAMSIPDVFAAIAPICGGGMYWNAARLLNVPVWAFHGGKDDTVFPEESEKMVDAVRKAGGHARLTIYPENGHNAWSDTYSNPEVFAWLLQQVNSNDRPLSDRFTDSNIYG